MSMDLRAALVIIRKSQRYGVLSHAEAADAAKVLADSVDTANRRLAECEQLLLEGQRSEAIRQAELAPDLLEMVRRLNFPERQQWDDYCLKHGLIIAPPLNLDAAMMLNQAYVEEAPIHDLLRRHRLLALARAPLKDRLQVVRLLARADRTNPKWLDDVASYEDERLKEIKREIPLLATSKNWAIASSLMNELRSKQWNTAIPMTVLQTLTQLYEEARRIELDRRIQNLVPLVTEIIKKNDFNGGVSVERAIHGISHMLKTPLTDQAFMPLQEFLSWIGRRKAYFDRRQSLQEVYQLLDHALANGAGWVTIYNLMDRLRALGGSLPNELSSRYRRWQLLAYFKLALIIIAVLLGLGAFLTLAIIMGG